MMREKLFTADALRAMSRARQIEAAITELVEVEHDLEWIWYESPADLQDAVATALAAVRTATRALRQAVKGTA